MAGDAGEVIDYLPPEQVRDIKSREGAAPALMSGGNARTHVRGTAQRVTVVLTQPPGVVLYSSSLRQESGGPRSVFETRDLPQAEPLWHGPRLGSFESQTPCFINK